MNSRDQNNLRFNFTVNILDGGFFGTALGIASFITIIPLFVSKLTDSAIVIGLIPAIHAVGWQLPQLLTAPRVSRLSLYKPMALIMTVNERLPFVGLALVAWFSPQIGVKWSLVLTFILLVWQGFGGGLTATAWTSLIAKIIPPKLHGTFFGVQSAVANLMAAFGAIIAGLILVSYQYPLEFTLCFILASLALGISLFFLSLTKEDRLEPASTLYPDDQSFWFKMRNIIKEDDNFRGYLFSRMLAQFATMGFAFYTVYAVEVFEIGEGVVGILTASLMFTEVAMNPLLGWIGDQRGHLLSLKIGGIAMILSSLLAWGAQGIAWFIPMFILAGISYVAAWTIPLAMTLEFGSESQRPTYIGLANTLVAPSTFIAPLLAGWLIDNAGYQAAFIASAVAGVVMLLILVIAVNDPRRKADARVLSPTSD